MGEAGFGSFLFLPSVAALLMSGWAPQRVGTGPYLKYSPKSFMCFLHLSPPQGILDDEAVFEAQSLLASLQGGVRDIIGEEVFIKVLSESLHVSCHPFVLQLEP